MLRGCIIFKPGFPLVLLDRTKLLIPLLDPLADVSSRSHLLDELRLVHRTKTSARAVCTPRQAITATLGICHDLMEVVDRKLLDFEPREPSTSVSRSGKFVQLLIVLMVFLVLLHLLLIVICRLVDYGLGGIEDKSRSGSGSLRGRAKGHRRDGRGLILNDDELDEFSLTKTGPVRIAKLLAEELKPDDSESFQRLRPHTLQKLTGGSVSVAIGAHASSERRKIFAVLVGLPSLNRHEGLRELLGKSVDDVDLAVKRIEAKVCGKILNDGLDVGGASLRHFDGGGCFVLIRCCLNQSTHISGSLG